MKPSSQDHRTEYIAGLREFADWLEQNPQIEAPTNSRMLLPLTTNPAVEEFANIHGLTVEVDSDGNASADLKFGPIVYLAYGYADFQEFVKQNNEKQARDWADKNDMVIQPRDGGAA
ncbi:hypothetical protein OG747_36260 [Streptomyces sp. NBC_01384]|uniref:hypothetical protein n=1 Tax=Streptomyces sp. NBC_01384 TaxID=2903847 RepID=UPI00324EBF3F